MCKLSFPTSHVHIPYSPFVQLLCLGIKKNGTLLWRILPEASAKTTQRVFQMLVGERGGGQQFDICWSTMFHLLVIGSSFPISHLWTVYENWRNWRDICQPRFGARFVFSDFDFHGFDFGLLNSPNKSPEANTKTTWTSFEIFAGKGVTCWPTIWHLWWSVRGSGLKQL